MSDNSLDDHSAEAVEAHIHVDGVEMVQVLGPGDRLLRTLEAEHPGVDVHVRGNEITLSGAAPAVAAARRLIEEIRALVARGATAEPRDVTASSKMLQGDPTATPSSVLGQVILQVRGKTIRPKTAGQAEYVRAIDEHTIVFGIGPAGTG
ncbi:MAG: PhoH family protein, partial [Agromyces sp.]